MDPDEFTRAAVGLRHRSSDELADFIEDLLCDFETGAGDYARAFAAPDSTAAAKVIKESIIRWESLHRHDTYHHAAATAQRLEWTLSAIERCVWPHDPGAAFQLIVLFFEGDEALGQDDLDYLSDVFRHAGILFRKIGSARNPAFVKSEVERLLKDDHSGYRMWLTAQGSGV